MKLLIVFTKSFRTNHELRDFERDLQIVDKIVTPKNEYRNNIQYTIIFPSGELHDLIKFKTERHIYGISISQLHDIQKCDIIPYPDDVPYGSY